MPRLEECWVLTIWRAMGAFSAQPEVTHIETSIIFEHTRFVRLPEDDPDEEEST